MVAAIKISAAHLPPAGLHALIKQRTGDLHRRLDSAPALLALMRPGLDLPHYARILQRFAAAYARIEPLLRALESSRPAQMPAYRPRLPALLADRARLPDVVPIPELTPLGLPPAADAAAHYLGMRYVLEGSTQGARLISMRLEQNLPQLREKTFNYWQLQRDAAAVWPTFIRCLDQTGVGVEPFSRGAEAAFSVFLDAFLSPDPSA
jgi:heme oxygenase